MGYKLQTVHSPECVCVCITLSNSSLGQQGPCLEVDVVHKYGAANTNHGDENLFVNRAMATLSNRMVVSESCFRKMGEREGGLTAFGDAH